MSARAMLALAVCVCAATPSPAPLPDATPTLRGAVNTKAQTWSGTKKQGDPALVGAPARRLLHPDVNVVDFGADPTGVADSSVAVLAAINSFSGPSSSTCGTVIFPAGTFRLASTVRVKKACWFKGASYGTTIAADTGITAFKTERYNTATDLGSSGGDGARFSQLSFYSPSHKAPVRSAGETLTLGARRKMGPPLGQGFVVFTDVNEFYRHYEVTTAGTTDPDTDGPHSFGNDQTLAYDTQTANFTRLDFVTGATSGAFGRVIRDDDSGATGVLRLTSVSGTFQAGETVTDIHTGSAKASGAQAPASNDELDGTVRWKYIGPGSAIHIRTSDVILQDISVSYTSGNGIHVAAGDLECPGCFVNANGWSFTNVSISTADGHGLYLRGSDTNGGQWSGGSVGGNGGATTDESFSGTGFNIYDASFLGNTFSGLLFSTVAGHGGVWSSSIGGGSTFIGCYVEGQQINYAMGQNTVIVGGALGVSPWVSTGAATGSSTWNAAPVVRIGVNGSAGQSWFIQETAISPSNWRPSTHMLLGIQRLNGGGIYTVITQGVTAASGGPTGTGSDITDGTVHWRYDGAPPTTGSVALGGSDSSSGKTQIETTVAGEDVGLGLAGYDAFEKTNSVLATHVRLSRYGFSGSDGRCYPDQYNLGRHRAINHTTMTYWPMHVPAGSEFWSQLWLGLPKPVRFTAQDTTDDPTCGVWNRGDRIYYADAAVSAGGVEGKICTTAGTAGTYAGGRTITCDGSHAYCTLSGAAMSTLYDQHEFWVGDRVTIDGGATRHVIDDSADGLTLTFDSTPSSCSACSIAFVAPVFKTFGSIAP